MPVPRPVANHSRQLTPMKRIKRSIVAVMGGTVLAVGLALIVLPGPAFIVVPACKNPFDISERRAGFGDDVAGII